MSDQGSEGVNSKENENGGNNNNVTICESNFEDNNASLELNLNNQPISKSDENADDPEFEAIAALVMEMEEEAEKLKQMQDEVKKQTSHSQFRGSTDVYLKEKTEVDSRSIYVGNVDYSATTDDLERHFYVCGSMNRVTILYDNYTGHPKGFAYIEFAEKDSVKTATALDGSLFKGRQIKVNAKRTNLPGINTSNRVNRGSLRGARRGVYVGRGSPWVNSFRHRRRPHGHGPWGFPY